MTTETTRWMCNLADATAWVAAILKATLLGENEDAMKRIKSYYPVTMSIDDEPVTLHVRRMSTVEMEEFDAKMRGFGYSFDGTVAEEAKHDATNSRDMAVWLAEVISKNVTLPTAQLCVEDEDGKEVEIRTGAALVAQFGGRVDFIPALIAYIWGENRLPEKRKVLFRDAASTAVNNLTPPILPALDLVPTAMVPPEESAAPAPVVSQTPGDHVDREMATLPFSAGSTAVS
jgi:hypothetical protein